MVCIDLLSAEIIVEYLFEMIINENNDNKFILYSIAYLNGVPEYTQVN